jgi:uncharacterized membrane protein
MFKLLIKHNKFNQTILLAVLCFISIMVFLFRLFVTDSIKFIFLNWNLFLAAIPWLITTFLIIFPKLQNKKIILIFLLFFWLIFFPNAPYILTDLFHLKFYSGNNIWFDLVLILLYAWTGLLFGLLSLIDIENIMKNKINKFLLSGFSSILLFIASFGIYIGRFLRWNSWDIIDNPHLLLFDLSDRLINPLSHPKTWGFTIFMGLLLNVIYWSLKVLNKEKK